LRILFISHYFPPESNAPASRTHEHCRRWVAEGHEVTVITGVPNHPAGRLFPGFENRLIQEEKIDGIRVIRTWLYLTPNEGFFKRTLGYVLFGVAAILASFKVRRPDVVIATSPQFFCGLAGMLISWLKWRPFVLEIRDLWPDSIAQVAQVKSRPVISFLEKLETLLYRSAAGIVVNTSAFIDHIEDRGVSRDDIALVFNGIDPTLFYPQPADEALLEGNGLRDCYTVAYIGTLGMAHGLGTIVEAAELLRDHDDIHFVLIGDGAARQSLEDEIAKRGLDNIVLLGLRPRQQIPAWIASIDLQLVMLRDLEVFRTVIPSKTFEFLAQERPILISAPRGEIRELVDGAKAGFTIDAERSTLLAETILAIKADPEEAASRAHAGRRWVMSEFVRDELAMKMLGFVERVVGDQAGSGDRS
jgi:glycosyltransferase involved in cell wall biosynthesis